MTEMNFTKYLQTVPLHNGSFDLFVPLQSDIQQAYLEQKSVDANADFPYWAKVWPSAIGLSMFLQAHPQLLQDKQVLELAAGLGLPSLVAAKYAQSVCCSDYVKAPLDFVEASADHHQLTNIDYQIINWFTVPSTITADVLLLSDINYEPAAFAVLFEMIQVFLAKQTTIILSTPQRLLAKPFIAQLLAFSTFQTEIEVLENGVSVWVQVLLLQQ
ncbi:class I SAM-dependent methyltransferase [Parasediminibacterium paludis]|uniref:Class I SAM-dependent methyltransferase n=1 Tax=Parasediminibacterium paludis TaxID=908966 RepID=A0ABV8PX83_9BACT